MSASNTVKRISMYFVVAIGILFVGLIAYYFGRNDEKIAFTIEEGSVVYMNKGESIYLPIEHSDPNSSTEEFVEFSNANVASYSKATKSIKAVKGGVTSVTVSFTNKKFGPFRFDIFVGDGSEQNPYYIRSAQEFNKIGKEPKPEEEKWETSDSYELIANIDLNNIYSQENPYWTPIEAFSGKFNGGGYTISNLKIQGEHENVGLFAIITETGKVENLKIKNAIISPTTANTIGILAGINQGFIGKVIVEGKINYLKGYSHNSTEENLKLAKIGGVVGFNSYSGVRPILNMVSANVEIVGGGIIGGLIGENVGGVLFNSYVELKKISQTDVDSIIVNNSEVGALVGVNNAIKITTVTPEIFRQTILKNNYAIVVDRSSLVTELFVVSENIEIPNLYDYKNTYVSNYASGVIQKINGKDATDQEIALKTLEQLKTKETFEGWNFNSIWNLEDKYPTLKLENSYENIGIADPGNVLQNASDVMAMLEKISQNPRMGLSYTISSQTPIVIDLKDRIWKPIGNTGNSFNGSIIVEKGTSLTIKNINIQIPTEELHENVNFFGFFGIIDYNAIVKNIKFENITIDMTNVSTDPQYHVGGIAGGLHGTIEDCYVDGIVIKNAVYAGFVVGHSGSQALIKNTHVGANYVEGKENKIEFVGEHNISMFYGGITAELWGQIENCSIDNASIDIETTSNLYIGGIAGYLPHRGKISHGYNKGLIATTTSSKGNFGGIAGTIHDSTIEYSYNLGSIYTTISSSNESWVGGIVGYLSSGSMVAKSFSEPILLRGRLVGGIACISYGLIKECYSAGDYEGWSLGGLTYINGGTITHCMVKANLKSISQSKDDFVAGIAGIIKTQASVSYVFSTATMTSSKAKKYAESFSNFRYTDIDYHISNLLSGFQKERPGSLTNCIVINYGDAEIQTTSFGRKPGFINATEDDVRGLTINKVFENAGFVMATPQIWEFRDGEYPILKNVVPNPLHAE